MASAISLKSKDEAQESSFGLLDEDDYRVRVDSFQEVSRVSKFNPEGLPTIDFILTPLGFADGDAELVDQDGQPVHPEKHLIFFYDPRRLGTRPQISRSRKFLASAMGVPPEGHIDIPGGLNELIGKELIATVSIKDGKNNITDTRPLRRRERVRVAAPAAEIAESDTEETDEF
jgi:hypothetical protein